MAKKEMENIQEAAQATEEKTDMVVVDQETVLHKAIKWGIMALGLIATGVAGFFIGRAGSDEDEETEEAKEEATEA